MFLLFSCGVLLWLIYGILLHALSTSIMAMKVRDMLARQRRLRSADQRTL